MERKKNFVRNCYGITILGICLFCIIIRAHYSAITLDEAHTYIDYVTKFRFGDIQGFLQDYDGRANNHLLNTAFMWMTDRLSGIHYDEFMVRFPNVCFGIGYCVFCFILFYKKEIPTFLFSILMLNSSINGSFALGRGYGMATFLSLLAIYFVKCYVASGYSMYSQLSWAICFFTLAEAANTVVLLLTASTAILLFIIMVKRKILLTYLKQAWPVLVPLGIFNLLLLMYHFYVSADGEGKELASFHGNPIMGIVGSFVGMYTGRIIVGVSLFLLILGCALMYGIFYKKRSFFVLLFFIYFILCSLMAVLFGKGMPSNLALLPTCPLILFALGEAVDILWDVVEKILLLQWHRLLWLIFTGACCCLGLRHFMRTVDFTINNDLRVKLYDTAMGSFEGEFDTEEFRLLHDTFYQKQFLYRYGYDIYQKKYTIETMSLAETLRMLANRKFDALIEVNDKSRLEKYAYEFKRLGINIRTLPKETDYILLKWNSEEPMQYIYNLKGANNTQETIMGKLDLFYGEEDSYGVYMNGYECLTVKPREEQPIAAICVWQDEKEEPMDYKVYVE